MFGEKKVSLIHLIVYWLVNIQHLRTSIFFFSSFLSNHRVSVHNSFMWNLSCLSSYSFFSLCTFSSKEISHIKGKRLRIRNSIDFISFLHTKLMEFYWNINFRRMLAQIFLWMSIVWRIHIKLGKVFFVVWR